MECGAKSRTARAGVSAAASARSLLRDLIRSPILQNAVELGCGEANHNP